MRRILVLRGGALGDFIVTLPALALLRQRWPDARLELVGNATAAQLVRGGGLLDAVHSQHESRWAALFNDAPLPDELARQLAAFDLVVNYWPDPDGALRRKFPLHPGQRFVSTTALPTRSPAAAHYCEPLEALGLETRTFFCGLEEGFVVPGDAPIRRRSAIRDRVAIHPGSGSRTKNWPLDRWAAIADWVKRTHGCDVLAVLGEAERTDALPGSTHTAHHLPLNRLAAELSTCRLFLGHDSGVSHLAAACGVPCVLLFGPTDPAMWAPPAPHVTIIQRDAAMEAIPVADVQSAVDAALADRM